MKNIITIADIIARRPCNSYEQPYRSSVYLRKLFGGRDWIAPLEICELLIPIEDRLWALLDESIIPAPQLRLLGCHWARCTIENERLLGHEPDPRNWAVIEVAKRYAAGNATKEELETARDAAWSTAHYGASSAAIYAAGVASSSAKSSASCAAYDTAIFAKFAASYTYRLACLDAQLEGVRVLLRWIKQGNLTACAT